MKPLHPRTRTPGSLWHVLTCFTSLRLSQGAEQHGRGQGSSKVAPCENHLVPGENSLRASPPDTVILQAWGRHGRSRAQTPTSPEPPKWPPCPLLLIWLGPGRRVKNGALPQGELFSRGRFLCISLPPPQVWWPSLPPLVHTPWQWDSMERWSLLLPPQKLPSAT